MAKKKSRKNNIPPQRQQSKMPKNAVAEKVEAAIGDKPDATVLSEATPEELGKVEDICDQLIAIKLQYESDSESLGVDKAQLEVQKAELETDRSSLEDRLSGHDQAVQQLEKIKGEQLQKEKQLIEKESSLSLREAEAEAGFVAQHGEALGHLTSELSKLRASQRETLEHNQQEVVRSAQSLDEERKKALDEIQDEWRRLEVTKSDLKKQLVELTEKQSELTSKEASREAWEQAKREQIDQQYNSQIAQLEADLEAIKSYRSRDTGQLVELKKRLSDYAELERLLQQKDMDSAEDLFLSIEKLEAEIRQYRQKIEGRPLEELEEDVSYLKDLNQTLEDQLREKTQELQEANLERHQRAMGVMEREQLVMKNRVLQQHNDAISLATGQLKREIDDLKDMQQGQSVFEALSRMDKDLSESVATQPVPSLSDFVSDLQVRISQQDPENPLYFSADTLRLFIAGLAMSHLHILQGISGTGKTSLAKAFATAVGGSCTVIPVQAGWRDRDDLVGHYNAFEKRFYEKECLQALYRAQCPEYSDRLNVILLDEMNLSRPEQYFAEFLSAMEPAGDKHVVLMENAPTKSPRNLKDGRKITIPDNTWFIGTANHDETTFEFADKTQDRSFVLELERNDQFEVSSTLKNPAIYSMSSLRTAFSDAVKRHRPEVDRIFQTLKQDEITEVLEKRFGIGWGNRLERQARQFIPVVMAAGGTSSQALDHLLSVRLFRDGKVTGRYDTKPEHLNKLQSCLNSVWEKISTEDVALYCDLKLSQEIDRKEMA